MKETIKSVEETTDHLIDSAGESAKHVTKAATTIVSGLFDTGKSLFNVTKKTAGGIIEGSASGALDLVDDGIGSAKNAVSSLKERYRKHFPEKQIEQKPESEFKPKEVSELSNDERIGELEELSKLEAEIEERKAQLSGNAS